MRFRSRRPLFSLVFAAGWLAVGCAAGGAAQRNDAAGIRAEMRKPHTPKEVEKLLQPKKLSSIGEQADLIGVEPLNCVGMGLVTGLGEHGSESTVQKEVFDAVVKALVREEGRTVKEASEMVRGRDSSVVVVHGSIPAGAGPGAVFDVTVEPADTAPSLEGGYLHRMTLTRYVTGTRGTVTGEVVARAEGAVTAGAAETAVIAGAADMRRGVVFDGAKYAGERFILVQLKPRYASGSATVLMEYMLNRRFRTVGVAPGGTPVNYATAADDRELVLLVPPIYRRYVERYADVVNSIEGSYFYGTPSESRMKDFGDKLASGSREEKYAASCKLEGIGTDSVPYILSAIRKGDDWSLVYGATALAYLNNDEAGDLVTRASQSDDEDVRYEAVRLMSQMSGRSVIQTLRDRMYDESKKVAAEAVRGLVSAGPEAAQVAHFATFDLVAVPGAKPGMLVDASGRPMVAVGGVGVPIEGKVEISAPGVGLGSVNDSQIGVITGKGASAQTSVVDATVENVVAAVAGTNPTFDSFRRLLEQLETRGNLPYKIAWLE